MKQTRKKHSPVFKGKVALAQVDPIIRTAVRLK